VKRGDLLRHLRQHGCYLKREGASHSLWTSPQTGHTEAVPRHTEIRMPSPERSAARWVFQKWGSEPAVEQRDEADKVREGEASAALQLISGC
jgi:hypothetical protein